MRRNRDVNGEFPVGGQLPIPVPTGQKFPRPHPRECQRGKFLPHPCPRAGISSPWGPRPRHKIQVATMDESESKIQRNNPSKFIVKKNLVHLVCHEIDLVPISENLNPNKIQSKIKQDSYRATELHCYSSSIL